MLIALILSAALLPGDEVVMTANDGPGAVLPTVAASIETPTEAQTEAHGLTTQEQIDRWLAAGNAGAAPDGVSRLPEAGVHGEVVVEVGTGGYRGVGVSVEGPIGERGRGSITWIGRRFDH